MRKSPDPVQTSVGIAAAIEPGARVLNLSLMLRRPSTKRFHRLSQAPTKLRQFIVDSRRNGRENGARDQPIALQTAQGERQHPLRNAADPALDLVEALWAVAERHNDEHAPFVADSGKYRGDPATVAVEVRLRRQDGNLGVLRFQRCARVSIMCVLVRHSQSLI
jgi:hypothetical protein